MRSNSWTPSLLCSWLRYCTWHCSSRSFLTRPKSSYFWSAHLTPSLCLFSSIQEEALSCGFSPSSPCWTLLAGRAPIVTVESKFAVVTFKHVDTQTEIVQWMCLYGEAHMRSYEHRAHNRSCGGPVGVTTCCLRLADLQTAKLWDLALVFSLYSTARGVI